MIRVMVRVINSSDRCEHPTYRPIHGPISSPPRRSISNNFAFSALRLLPSPGARCKLVVYCSRACHKAAWPTHQHKCQSVEAQAATDPVEELLREHAPDAMKCPISYVFIQRIHAHARRTNTGLALAPAFAALASPSLSPSLAFALIVALAHGLSPSPSLAFALAHGPSLSLHSNIPLLLPAGKRSCRSR